MAKPRLTAFWQTCGAFWADQGWLAPEEGPAGIAAAVEACARHLAATVFPDDLTLRRRYEGAGEQLPVQDWEDLARPRVTVSPGALAAEIAAHAGTPVLAGAVHDFLPDLLGISTPPGPEERLASGVSGFEHVPGAAPGPVQTDTVGPSSSAPPSYVPSASVTPAPVAAAANGRVQPPATAPRNTPITHPSDEEEFFGV